MPIRHSLSTVPTYDLTQFHFATHDWSVIFDTDCLYLESDAVFHFDGVYALMIPRSRVLRADKEESKRVQNVFGATIDAGFTGKLVWKIVLTPFALSELQIIFNDQPKSLPETYISHFTGAQQIMLFTSTGGNYYNGTNQTQLTPDIIFTL